MGMNELASVRICVLDDVVGFINVNSRVVVFESIKFLNKNKISIYIKTN